jgi:GrpB-like predicted nucleotidyltransferase (UPF0157 family)
MNKYSYRSYKLEFPEIYKKEKELIEKYIKGNYQIEHVGSTAVAGLGGKGIIDIMIGTKKDKMMAIVKQAGKLDYKYIPQASYPNRLFLHKPYPKDFDKESAYHLHVANIDSDDWKNTIAFRDYLKTHPEDLEKYAQIKQKAANAANGDKETYMRTKERVIREILKKICT